MEPIYDAKGKVYGWVDRQTGRIINLRGKHVAFVDGDSVFSWNGKHIGWWQNDHIRNQSGQVAVFLRGASGLGPAIPALAATPARPAIAAVPARPALSARPARSARKTSWAPLVPF